MLDIVEVRVQFWVVFPSGLRDSSYNNLSRENQPNTGLPQSS